MTPICVCGRDAPAITKSLPVTGEADLLIQSNTAQQYIKIRKIAVVDSSLEQLRANSTVLVSQGPTPPFPLLVVVASKQQSPTFVFVDGFVEISELSTFVDGA